MKQLASTTNHLPKPVRNPSETRNPPLLGSISLSESIEILAPGVTDPSLDVTHHRAESTRTGRARGRDMCERWGKWEAAAETDVFSTLTVQAPRRDPKTFAEDIHEDTSMPSKCLQGAPFNECQLASSAPPATPIPGVPGGSARTITPPERVRRSSSAARDGRRFQR